MHATRYYLAAISLGLAFIVTAGCDSDSPLAPPRGAIEISVVTEGMAEDVDPDGYSLSLDRYPGRADVGVNGITTLGGLPPGAYLVRLGGLAPNCSVVGANPRTIVVFSGMTASPLSFSVLCVATTDGAGAWDY